MTQGTPWEERETELLTILRPTCTDPEITRILNLLGFPRTQEAVSRKSRRLHIRLTGIGQVHLDNTFSNDERTVISNVLNCGLADGSTYYTPSEKPIEVALPVAMPEDEEEELGDVDWEALADVVPEAPELDPSVDWITGPMPLVDNQVTKFVMMNDVHVPHNIPLDAIWKFCNDFKPDYLLLVGDILNMDPFNHWDKEKPAKTRLLPKPKAYYQMSIKRFYQPARDAVGPECRIVHWIGNHEAWANKAIEYNPDGEGYWEIWNNIPKNLVDVWVPSKGVASLGHLHFLHGDILKGGKYHPHQFLQYYNRSIRYGHYHDIGTASHTSPIDITDRHVARCNGCLEKYNPGFMENRPHDWQHAFSYGWVKPTGIFHDEQVVLIDNSFITMGKTYG